MSSNVLSPVSQRIREIIDADFRGSVRKFCLYLGLTDSQKINRLFHIDSRNGKYPNPSYEVLKLISTRLNIPLEWLTEGRGERRPIVVDNSYRMEPERRQVSDVDRPYVAKQTVDEQTPISILLEIIAQQNKQMAAMQGQILESQKQINKALQKIDQLTEIIEKVAVK